MSSWVLLASGQSPPPVRRPCADSWLRPLSYELRGGNGATVTARRTWPAAGAIAPLRSHPSGTMSGIGESPRQHRKSFRSPSIRAGERRREGRDPRRRGVPSPGEAIRSPLTRSFLYKSERMGERKGGAFLAGDRPLVGEMRAGRGRGKEGGGAAGAIRRHNLAARTGDSRFRRLRADRVARCGIASGRPSACHPDGRAGRGVPPRRPP
jgi:hypothetical protein